MGLLSKLQYNQTWTNTEKKLVNFILQYPEKVIMMSSNELCDSANTSLSNVYRVCHKLEVGGYADLKLELTKELKQNEKKEIDYNSPFTRYNTDYEIMEIIEELYYQTINETKSLLDLDKIRIAAKMLDEANYINIYTSSGNVQVANSFKRRMADIGKIVRVLTINYDQETEAIHTNKETASIILSYAGRNKDIIKIAKLLKKRNQPILLISSLLDKTFTEYCYIHLLLCSKETHERTKIADYSSTISAQYVFDVLFAVIFKRNFDDNMKYINNAHSYYLGDSDL